MLIDPCIYIPYFSHIINISRLIAKKNSRQEMASSNNVSFLSRISIFLILWVMCMTEQIDSRSANKIPGLLNMPHADIVTGLKAKRQRFDASCIGIFDPDIIRTLEEVCNGCYNLYRNPNVATECRRNCFNSKVFEGCMHDLMLADKFDEFKDMVSIVSGRKK